MDRIEGWTAPTQGRDHHRPWKSDTYGYICASCFVLEKNEEIDKLNVKLLEKEAAK